METIKTNVVEHLTQLRVELDLTGKELNLLPKNRYSSLAITSLEKGRMYVGEVCRLYGKEYPYEATKRATTAEGIQPAVDLSSIEPKFLNDNEIQNLNQVRESLNEAIEDFVSTIFDLNTDKLVQGTPEYFRLNCVVSEAYRGLLEARMWLGKRLGEIRDNATKGK